MPFALEVFGRLGQAGEGLFRTLGAAAKRVAMHAGKAPGRSVPTWRAAIDAALQRSNAEQLIAALHGLPGRAAQPVFQVDRTAVEVGFPSASA